MDFTLIGIGVFVLLNIVGWVLAFNRYSRNEAMHLGELKGTVTGLATIVESLGKRIESLEKRIDDFITSRS
ncbi:hypothetical protein ES703_107934 [subsurface metagenome]